MPLLACSSNKRDDSAMPQPVKQTDTSSSSGSGSGSATPTAQPMVYLGTPAGDIPVKVEVVATFPAESHAPIVYPFALVKDARAPAVDFLRYLQSPEAAGVFRRLGFTALKH